MQATTTTTTQSLTSLQQQQQEEQEQEEEEEGPTTLSTLFGKIRELTTLLRQAETHVDEVVTWAERCSDARSMDWMRMGDPEEKDTEWIAFARDLRNYIESILSQSQGVEDEIQNCFAKIDAVRDRLQQRILELEERQQALEQTEAEKRA